MSNLSEWYNVHAPEDAKVANNSKQFPDPLEIAPLLSDAYSSGEHTYMSGSVNTAMSYPMALFEFETDTLHQGGKTDKSSSTSVQTKDNKNLTCWAQRVHRSQRSLSMSATDTQSITHFFVPSFCNPFPSVVRFLVQPLHRLEHTEQ
jgi:hypothetical protein